MSQINVAVSKTINAPANQVYSILADYRNHHPHILPQAYFTGLEVEEGGTGEGTVFRATLQVMGQKQSFRMRVTEPEPGRVMAENDLDTGLVTTFTVEPRGDNRSEVTIATTFQPSPGLRGLLERLITPMLLQRIYRQELQQLEEYTQWSNQPTGA
jgi:ribosome-associated toxin RatA of RatAB toxin-antitoxin module